MKPAIALLFAAASALAQQKPAPPIAPEIQQAMLGTKEMADLRDCARENANAYALLKAAGEVMKSVQQIRATKEPSQQQRDLLATQWKEYKQHGGTAASPEQVVLPPEPCKALKEAAQIKAFAMTAAYRQCAATRSSEIRLAVLSKDVMRGRTFLEIYDKLPPEQRARAPLDPVQVRAELAKDFKDYRAAGGPASRLEDVREIPNPCVPVPAK